MRTWSISTSASGLAPKWSCCNSSGLARETLGGKLVSVLTPIGLVLASQVGEVGPTVDAGGMQVVEYETHRIVADGLDLKDRHILLAGDRLALVGRMTLDLRAGAFDPEKLG